MKIIRSLCLNRTVGRVTPCAPNADVTKPAQRGLTRPATADSSRPAGRLRFNALALATALLAAAGGARADTFTNLGLAIRVAGPAKVEMSWDTATNAGYRLEYCSTLTSNAWTPLCSVSGDGHRCCTNDTLLATQPRYYRVALTPAATSWKKLFGGSSDDFANSVEPTSDGGYVIGGAATSLDGDCIGGHGASDGFVLKIDRSGAIQWKRCLGGKSFDEIRAVAEAAAGGYICAGYTFSNDGDVSGNHGGYDGWLVKLSTNGVVQWQKCLGGTNNDGLLSGQQTADGGYIFAGYTESNEGDVSGNHGVVDAWVVKTDAAGNFQWQKCLGGSGADEAHQIQQTADGGYILVGYTYSNDGDVSGNHGGADGWVVKLNTNGVVQWQRVMGGSDDDELWSVQQTKDGGYVAAGHTYSCDGDISRTNCLSEYSDCWVVKLDGNGNTQWQKFIGGSDDDVFRSICQTSDGGYIAAGYTGSTDVPGQHGSFDVYLCKLDAVGGVQWQRCLGGSDTDYAQAVRQAGDGGYIVENLP
jgi:hypothetical protein